MSIPFQILGINHIGIAPKSPSTTVDLFQTIGLEHLGDELVKEQQTNTRMFGTGQAVGSRLEILENEEGKEGPIKKFLDKKGGGIHHIALMVDDVAKALAYLTEQGVEMIDKTPRPGAHNTMIGFVHPRAAGGVLIELVQEQD